MLLTGATGFLGMEVLSRYLERTDRDVLALVRAADDAEAEVRLRSVLTKTFGSEDAHRGRVRAISGHLDRPGLGLDPRMRDSLVERVDTIVHAGATVSFTEPLDRARATNVDGTRRLLDLAERIQAQGTFRMFCHISSTYVAGTYDGRMLEDDLDVGQEFHNSYERSKFEAERLVREHAERLPTRIVRPSIVVGERGSGWTGAFNVLYYPVMLFAKGVNPPIIPARRATPIDVVPIDYVADAVFALSEHAGEDGKTYHLVAGNDAVTIGHVLDTIAHSFGRRPPLLVPLRLYNRTLHPIVSRIYRGKRKRQLDAARAYLPYFSMSVTFDDKLARRELAPLNLSVSPLDSYFDQLIEFARASEWGRVSISRADARARWGSPPESGRGGILLLGDSTAGPTTK